MKLSKIKANINNNGSATIYHHNNNIECVYILRDKNKNRRSTKKYKSLEIDIPVDQRGCTILKWNNNNYINYYDERD